MQNIDKIITKAAEQALLQTEFALCRARTQAFCDEVAEITGKKKVKVGDYGSDERIEARTSEEAQHPWRKRFDFSS